MAWQQIIARTKAGYMNKVQSVLRIIGSVLGISILIYQAYYSLNAIQTQEVQLFSYSDFGLGIFVIIIAIGLHYCAWNILMRGFMIKVPLLDGFRGFILSYIARYIPGTIWGYLNRNEWLSMEYNVPHRISFWGSICEIGLSVLASITMVGIQKLFQTNQIFNKWLYTLLLILLPIFSWFFVKFIVKLRFFKHWLPESEYLMKFYSWKNWFITLAMLVGTWLLYGAMVHLCLQAFGISTLDLFKEGTIIQLSGIFSISWLAGFIIVLLPSGLGVRELTLAALLPTIMPVSHSQAVAVSVASRLITILAELILVAIFGFSSIVKKVHHY